MRIRNTFTVQTVQELGEKKCQAVLSSPWMRLLHAIAFNRTSGKEMQLLEQTVGQTTVDSCSFRSPVILLVIGESYNKYHTPLYNPESLPTTPRLCRRAGRLELFPFTDVVTVSNTTTVVFKHLFSVDNANASRSWTSRTLFPALFKEAGYEVWFISNQFVRLDKGSLFDWVGGAMFNYGRLDQMMFTMRNRRTYPYDGELLREIDTARLADGKPKLVIFHLIGQHVNYEERYPRERHPFTEEDVHPRFGGEKERETAMHYANATHYNDEVVDSLFGMFSGLETIGIYLSDHGEEVYDYRNCMMRTHEPQMTREVAKYQYEVPFMIYMSPSYRERHADIVEQVKAARHVPFVSDDLSQLLLYLGGIGCKEYDPARNVLSPSFNAGRKRILRGDTDYDALCGP